MQSCNFWGVFFVDFTVLDDWMTTPSQPFNSKITEYGDEVVHSHRFYEIFYILEGSISHTLNGKTHMLHSGDVVFLNQTDVHHFNREEGNLCKHRDIIISTEFFDSICAFMGEAFETAYHDNMLPKVVSITLEQMESVVNEIELELQNSLSHEVPSSKIGVLVMEKLKALDEVAYVRFASVYREFKDLDTFMRELEKLKSQKNER